MHQTKGTTSKEVRLERVSLNKWNWSTYRCEVETCDVLASVKGTAGTLAEFAFATLCRLDDGTEELKYLCPAVEAAGTLKSFVEEFDERQLVIIGKERELHWFIEKVR